MSYTNTEDLWAEELYKKEAELARNIAFEALTTEEPAEIASRMRVLLMAAGNLGSILIHYSEKDFPYEGMFELYKHFCELGRGIEVPEDLRQKISVAAAELNEGEDPRPLINMMVREYFESKNGKLESYEGTKQ